MIAAIYARKSSDEGDRETDAKSVTVQIADARAYATSQGWTVDDRYVYSDDGVSGAAFTREQRPAFFDMLTTLSPLPPFGTLVVTEQSRIGRDTFRTLSAIQQITDAGVRVFESRKKREIKLDEEADEVQEFMGAWSSSAERRKARERTRPVLQSKARSGYVASGKVFGYENVAEGDHVVRKIVAAEAVAIRRIFELTAEGYGLHRVREILTAEQHPSPRRGGWHPSGIRSMLRRDLYRGRLVWGRTTWRWRAGKKCKVQAPDTDLIVREMQDLRIISEDLWKGAHAAIAWTRQTYTGLRRPDGRLEGRPESVLVSKHLLAGFLSCGVCGSNMFVTTRIGRKGDVVLGYACGTHRKRGSAKCSNRWTLPYWPITQDVIDFFSHRFLTEDTLGRFVDLDYVAGSPHAIQAEREGLQADLKGLDGEIAKLVEAVTASGSSIPALVEAMTAKQRARDNASARIEALSKRTASDRPQSVRQFLAAGGQWIVDLEEIVERDPAEGRRVLRELLAEPITIRPVETEDGGVAFDYSAEAKLDPVFTGRIAGPKGAYYDGRSPCLVR